MKVYYIARLSIACGMANQSDGDRGNRDVDVVGKNCATLVMALNCDENGGNR